MTVSLVFDGPVPHVLPILQSSKVAASKNAVEVSIDLLAGPEGRMARIVLPMSLDAGVGLMGQLQAAITAAL
jgi:hypothetical protein